MKKDDAIFCYKVVAYLSGYLSAFEDVEVPSQLAEVLRIIEKELKGEPEPKLVALEPKRKRQPAKKTEAPTESEQIEEQAQEEQPEEETVPMRTDIEVANRKECKGCQFRKRTADIIFCDYIGKTKKARKCPVSVCEHYKDPKIRKYLKTCEKCGREFYTSGPAAKLCEACKKAKK